MRESSSMFQNAYCRDAAFMYLFSHPTETAKNLCHLHADSLLWYTPDVVKLARLYNEATEAFRIAEKKENRPSRKEALCMTTTELYDIAEVNRMAKGYVQMLMAHVHRMLNGPKSSLSDNKVPTDINPALLRAVKYPPVPECLAGRGTVSWPHSIYQRRQVPKRVHWNMWLPKPYICNTDYQKAGWGDLSTCWSPRWKEEYDAIRALVSECEHKLTKLQITEDNVYHAQQKKMLECNAVMDMEANMAAMAQALNEEALNEEALKEEATKTPTLQPSASLAGRNLLIDLLELLSLGLLKV